MTDSIRDILLGGPPLRGLVDVITPRRTFDDVILPAETRATLDQALQAIRKHDLLFRRWGLGERHDGGLGLAFHFAGPPGTGKTICAEALAHLLERQLLVVRYAGLESRWAGQTAKHVASVFRAASRQGAVLFFDEADAIAGRRFSTATIGYEREANAVVDVLLHELERFEGIVIFATNLATAIDPAFERRIRTHVLFRLPGIEERERIWQAQLHPRKTPLADDVDFRALATEFARSGGDIKNAVLKAAQLATLEPVPDADKRIHQRHFEQGMREVIEAVATMGQSLFEEMDASVSAGSGPLERLTEVENRLQGEVALVAERVDRLVSRQDGIIASQADQRSLGAEVTGAVRSLARRVHVLTWLVAVALLGALGAAVLAVIR